MKKFHLILLNIYIVSAFGQTLPQKGADLYNYNYNSNDWNDIELSHDGNRAVFSDPYFSGNTGVVRVVGFINGSWSQIGNDILGDTNSSYSAYAVAISDSGNRIALTQQLSNASGTPSVRVYEDSLGSWVQVGSEILGQNWHCDISGDGTRIAVGEPQYNNQTGRVRIFEDSLGNWIQVGSELVGDSLDVKWGRKVKLSQDGSRIITGAFLNKGSIGQVKVFEDSSGTWVQVGNNLEGDAMGDEFGFNVSISNDGSRIAVGAPQGVASSSGSAGYARIFEESTGNWVQLGGDIFHPNNQNSSDFFGHSISVSGDGQKVVVSGGPSAVVYEVDSASNWTILGQTIGGGYGQTNFSGNGECSMAGDGESFGVFGFMSSIRVYYSTPCSFTASILEDIDTVSCSNGLAWVKLTDNYSYDSIHWSNGDVNVDSTEMTPGSYWVYVRTPRGCDTTFSFQTHYIQPPPINVTPCYIYCDLDTGLNRIVVETPTDFSRWYEWQLLEDVFGNWSLLSSRPIKDSSVWYHSNSSPFSKSYSYKLQAVDSCGVATVSPIVKTILLQSSQGTSGEVNLNWNAYEGADVWYYVINRKQGLNFVLLDSVGATTTTYIDNNAPSGNVSYYVTAVRQSPCGNNLFKSGANTRRFSSNTVSESVIGIDESSVNKISIHPNPTSGLIQVQLDESFDYEVYNLTGKLLAKDSGKEQIDISKLPAGTYTVIISNDDGRSTHTIQKI